MILLDDATSTTREVPDSWSRTRDLPSGRSAFVGLYEDGRCFVVYDQPCPEHHTDAPSSGEWLDLEKETVSVDGDNFRRIEWLSRELLQRHMRQLAPPILLA
jgi:hypothetical protein